MSDFSAHDLVKQLRQSLGCERAALADFLVALAELDRRRLSVELGFGSSWDFCCSALGLSETATHYRLAPLHHHAGQAVTGPDRRQSGHPGGRGGGKADPPGRADRGAARSETGTWGRGPKHGPTCIATSANTGTYRNALAQAPDRRCPVRNAACASA